MILWAMAYFNKSNEELGINKKNLISKKEIKKPEETKEEHKKDNQVSLFEEVQK